MNNEQNKELSGPQSNLTTPENRLAALREALSDSVQAIQRAASILREMEERRDDISSIPGHLVNLLRRVHQQLTLPGVVVNLGGTLRAHVSKLPLLEQQRLLEPEAAVEFVTPDRDVIMVSPLRLTPPQVRQVFGDGFIRKRAEQLAFLANPNARRRGRQKDVKTVEVDREKGTVNFHGKTITKAQIMRWLSQL